MAQSDLRFVISAADQASAPIESVKRKVQGLADTTRAASTSVTNSMQRMGRGVGGAAQQIGYQVADAAVQLQSGTNALMVFGQQGSQILSIFGPVGALLGAGVAIFSAFGYAALKASEGTEEAADAMQRLNEKLADAQALAGMARFGVLSADEAQVLSEIDALNDQIVAKMQEIAALEADVAVGGGKKAAFAAQALNTAKGELDQLVAQRLEVEKQLENYKAIVEINGRMLAIQDAHYKNLINQQIALQGVVQGYSMVEIAAIDAARASAVAANAANQPFIPSSGLGTFPEGTGPTFEDTGRMGSSSAPAPTILPTLDEIIAKYAKVGSAGSAAVDEISDATEELAKVSADYAQTIESELTSAFSAVLDGTATLGDALLDFASNVLQKIAEDLFAQQFAAPIGTAIGGIIGGIVPSANGNVFGPGGLTAFANGGVVSGPTVFPFANGTGLMGEAGPEAIMPLSRGPGGKLGVTANGNMAPNIVINNYTSEPATATTDTAGNTVIEIGRAVAEDIKAGGPTYKAIKSTFGISNKLQLRG